MRVFHWKPVEQFFENTLIFGSRWFLLPAYIVLMLSLVILAITAIVEFVQLIFTFKVYLKSYDEASVIAQTLVLVDLVLVMNLVLMILFVGYVNFVSVIRPEKLEDWPDWMGALDYSGLKVQVLGSIVAISAVKLLRAFLDLSVGINVDTSRLMWMTIILIVFVGSVVLLTLSNKMHVAAGDAQRRRFSSGDSRVIKPADL